MKKYTVYSLFFIQTLLLLSCNQDISNEKLGLYVKNSGLSPDEVKVFVNSQIIHINEIKYGQQLTIQIDGIDDFEKDNNNFVHPGGENSVVDEQNNVIFYVEDYFKKYGAKGVSFEDAKALKFNLTIGKPMEAGKKYHFLFRIWDKLNKKELKGNMEIIVI